MDDALIYLADLAHLAEELLTKILTFLNIASHTKCLQSLT